MVVNKDKQSYRTAQSVLTTRETPRTSCQTSQIMTNISVTPFYRISPALVLHRMMYTPNNRGTRGWPIQSSFVSRKVITIVTPNPACSQIACPVPSYTPSQNTSCRSVNKGHQIDTSFFDPMKVNSSSISTTLTVSGVGASGSWLT